MSIPEIIAIVVGIFTAVIAAASFVWKVRDRKPKVVVGFGVVTQSRTNHQRKLESIRKLLRVTATNHGPGVVTVTSIYAMDTSFWKKLCRKTQLWFIYYDPIILLGATELPKKLEVGDEISLFLPYNKECILSKGCTHIGVRDTFGRLNLAEKRDVNKGREQWLQDFGDKTTSPEDTNK